MLTAGELILNHTDGNLFFLAANSSVQRIGGTSSPDYGTVAANGTSLVASIAGDTLTVVPGVDMAVIGNAANDTVQIHSNMEHSLIVAVSSEKDAYSAGTANVSFRWPFAVTLSKLPRASLAVAGSTTTTVDINNGAGTSILSTKLTIDSSELTSVTAATPAVLSTSTFTDDELCTIDIDGVGTDSRGLKVTFYYRKA